MRDERIDRYEYPLLALFSTLGMTHDGLGEQPALALHGARAAEPAALRHGGVPPRQCPLDRGRAEVSSSWAPWPRACCSTAAPWSTASPAPSTSTRSRGLWSGEGAGAALPLGALVGLVFVVAGLAFKLAAVPFHMWTPDVYEGAPSPVTAFLAAAPKVAALGLMLRVLAGPFGQLDRPVAADRHRGRDRLDGAGRLRRHRPDQHQAADGLQRHRQYRLRAGRRRRRHAGRRQRARWSISASTWS